MRNIKKMAKPKIAKIRPAVGVIMGSDSDFSVMQEAVKVLIDFGIAHEAKIVSAHRTPTEMVRYATQARKRGLKVIIAGAGGAAHLPGMVASLTTLPVIGVPVPVGHLGGQDALYSIVQMPRGIPVATVAIGNAFNAALLAVQIIAIDASEKKTVAKLEKFRKNLREKVKKKVLPTI